MSAAAFVSTVSITGADPDHDGALARDALARCEVLYLAADQHPVDTRAYYNRLVERVGRPMDAAEDYLDGRPTGSRWSEIRYRSDVPDGVAFRHSKNAQPLHTDASYVSAPPQVMWFYCDNAAPSGGETIFVSGRALVEELTKNRPDLLARLTTEPVTYAKAEDARTRPIIIIGPDQTVDLNFNYYCVGADQDAAGKALNDEFFQYVEHELPPELVAAVGLRPGDAVAWWDGRVLHGRNAFTAAKTGDRSIWKTGLFMDVAERQLPSG